MHAPKQKKKFNFLVTGRRTGKNRRLNVVIEKKLLLIDDIISIPRMKFVRDELGRIYPLCQSTYSEVYLYLRFVLETNEKTLFHKKKKKGCFEGNEARLFISCQGRSSRKWRCCMHRVHVAFNAVFRPLDFNEAAIFEYTAFDIISHLDYLLFSFHHWKARLNKWYVKYIVQFLILYYMVLLEHAKRILLSRIRPTSETWLESISNEVLRTLLGIDITTFLSFARFFFQACALVYYS